MKGPVAHSSGRGGGGGGGGGGSKIKAFTNQVGIITLLTGPFTLTHNTNITTFAHSLGQAAWPGLLTVGSKVNRDSSCSLENHSHLHCLLHVGIFFSSCHAVATGLLSPIPQGLPQIVRGSSPALRCCITAIGGLLQPMSFLSISGDVAQW